MTADNERLAGQRALLRFLQHQGRLKPEDLSRLDLQMQQGGTSLPELLERERIITEKDLAALLATTLRLRLIDLTSFPLDPNMSHELREAVALRYEVVPIKVDNGTIEIATANPLDLAALKAVEFATGKRVQMLVATRLEVSDTLPHVYRLQESLDQFLHNVPTDQSLTLSEQGEEAIDLRSIVRESELPPVVKLADLILIEGIKSHASDVHVEPGVSAVAVRYRIDGILEESFRFPKWVQNALIARLKVMAKLDITERRLPQDGRLQVRFQERLVDMRMSSLPAQQGEKITLRILDAAASVHALDRLGFSAGDLELLRDALRRPEGLILLTGPTGSGKTTTLYALLRDKLSPNINIVTIENPIEYQLKGINQVEVNDKQGLTFAEVLRSVLRQDPDVILVGEIRDQETARIALRAAQTGHLVLSTLHTNDASGAVTRLIDLGIEPTVIASAVKMIVAQRLIRRVCQACGSTSNAADAAARQLLRIEEAVIRRAVGCGQCRQTGFAGRVGVYEVVPMTPAIARRIESGAGEIAVRQEARAEGHEALVEDARQKVLAGVTTTDEVMRVVQVASETPRCPACGQDVAEDYASCPHCEAVLQATCVGCARPLEKSWKICPYCGEGAHAVRGAASAEATSIDAPVEQPPAPLRRTCKALVVDDNETIRDVVRLALEQSGLDLFVITAENGNDALALAASERPDIVVLDVQMPGPDGFEVCRQLRSDVRTAFVPVMMLTVESGEESAVRAFAAGTDDYIVKPFRRDDLIARVRRMLERTYGKDAVPAPVEADVEPTAASAGPDPSAIEHLLASVSANLQTQLDELRRTVEQVRETQQRLTAVAVEPHLNELWKTIDQIRSESAEELAETRAAVDRLRTELSRN